MADPVRQDEQPQGEQKQETLTPEQIDAKIREGLEQDAGTGERTPQQTFADSLLADALELRERARNTSAETTANREMLRALVTANKLTPTQTSAVNALYPVRERKPAAAKPEAPTTPNGAQGVTVNPDSPAAKQAAKRQAA